MTAISFSRRLRETPFSQGVKKAGVKSYTVYNHMLLATAYESVEADYRHLKQHVQVWDVSVERQVELKGPDAGRLMQMLTPRNLQKMQADQCYYVPIVDDNGGMLNDPVAIKHSEDHWWISIADSDLLYWVKGIAVGMGLDVVVDEPDVFPLAVQGPKSEDLMVRVFGEEVRNIRFFRFKHLKFQEHEFIVARSGYSKQGGFEIYVDDRSLGMTLWNALFEAGEDLNVRAGCPNLIERIEGGLLSYGNDMTRANTLFECGLDKFCSFQGEYDFIGRRALLKTTNREPERKIRPIAISGEAVPPCTATWPVYANEKQVGHISSAAWSPDFETNVAIGMIDAGHWDKGTELTVQLDDGVRQAVIQEKFWI